MPRGFEIGDCVLAFFQSVSYADPLIAGWHHTISQNCPKVALLQSGCFLSWVGCVPPGSLGAVLGAAVRLCSFQTISVSDFGDSYRIYRAWELFTITQYSTQSHNKFDT